MIVEIIFKISKLNKTIIIIRYNYINLLKYKLFIFKNQNVNLKKLYFKLILIKKIYKMYRLKLQKTN